MASSKAESETHFTKNKTKMFVMGISIFLFVASIVLALASFLVPSNNFKIILLVTLLGFIVSLVLLINILYKLFASLDLINEKANTISKGDLNISDILVEKTKGLESLTIAFNDMKSNFLGFIELTKGNIVTLSDSIDKVSASIDMSYKSNEQIAINMGSIAERAQEQLKLVSDTIESLESSNSRIERVASGIDNIEKAIEKTVETTNAGTLNLEHFYSQLNTISNNLDNTFESIKQLNQEINGITEISEFIIQVSDQLKLLGLNAAIEAARAGEAGRGFTVVAHQIGELSSKTQESIKEINTIVVEVTKRSGNVNESIASSIDNFSESKVTFEMIQKSFSSINEQSDILNKDIKEIYEEINLISSYTRENKAKGTVLYSASDEISAKTQNVAAVTEEALAELEEITNNTSSLSNMLVGIQNLVKRFNTSVLPVEQKSPKKLKFIFISMLDHEFWYAIRRGVIYAKKELAEKNVEVEFYKVEAAWDNSINANIVAKMKECINNGYAGIVLPAFWSEAIPVIEEASRKGIPVMLFNCDYEVKTSRLAHFSPNVSEAGSLAAKLMIKALGDNGNVAIVRDELTNKVHAFRRTAILDLLKKHKKINIVKEIIAGDNSDRVCKEVKAYLSTNKDVQGVFVLGGGIDGAAKAIEELGLTRKVVVVGYDHSKEIFEYIKKGIIYAAIGQDPFGQGHDPLIWLYNYIVTGSKLPSENMWSRLDVVDSSNVNDLLTS